MSEKVKTPAAEWRELGEPDPHAGKYDCEREDLMMGDISDDALANGVFLNGNARPPVQDVVAGRVYMPIIWLTAAKQRIRWLSRQLVKATDRKAIEDRIAGACNRAGLDYSVCKKIIDNLE